MSTAIVSLALLAAVGWGLTLALGLVLAGERGHRYLFRALLWRRRTPLGHRHHAVIAYGRWFMASCECGYSERAGSGGGAEGALAAHLRSARPWAHYAGTEPCVGEVEHHVPSPADIEASIEIEAAMAEQRRVPHSY